MKDDSAPLSTGRRLGFTAAMLLLPVVFFVLLEGGLRLFGYGDTWPLFVAPEQPEGYLYQNREVARRYFYGQENVPTSLLDFFAAEKAPDAYRIFVQGGSSAAGFPYYYGGAFSRQLQQRLQQTFPDRTIEVINTGMAAVNSYTLLDLAGEIIAQQPDAVLIYAGHNEYYGALGVGSAESLGRSPSLVRLALRLQRFRTVQLLRGAIVQIASLGQGGSAAGNTLMARIVREQTIPYGSSLFQAGARQFESNLDALLARYREAGIPVFIATVASNERDHAPFVSVQQDEHAAGWAARLDRARTLLREAPEAARDTLRSLVATDSLDAESRYLLAQALEALGDTAGARPYFVAARDRDALRFRAPTHVNEIIRAAAARHGARLVPAEERLRQASPGGTIGGEVMLEHLHPTPYGYFLLADAFYDALREVSAIGTWEASVPEGVALEHRLLTPVDSTVGHYRTLQLLAGWPFQPVGVTLPYLDTLQARTAIDSIAQRLFKGELSWLEANAAQRDHFLQQGDLPRAIQAAMAASQGYPYDAQGYFSTATLLLNAQRFEEALAQYRRGNRINETSETVGLEGAILLQQGRNEAAVERLERAVALDATNVQARYNLAGAYARLRRFDEALQAIEAVLRAAPGYPGARDLQQQLSALAR